MRVVMIKPTVRGKTTIKGTTYEYALYNYKRPPGKPWHLIFIDATLTISP